MRHSVVRKEGTAPTHLTFGSTLEEDLTNFFGSRLRHRLTFGIGVREELGVVGAPDIEASINTFDLKFANRRDELELIVGSVFQEQLGEVLGINVDIGIGANGQSLCVDCPRQLQSLIGDFDFEEVALLDAERVVDHNVSKFVNTWIHDNLV